MTRHICTPHEEQRNVPAADSPIAWAIPGPRTSPGAGPVGSPPGHPQPVTPREGAQRRGGLSPARAAFAGAALDGRTSTALPCFGITPRGTRGWRLAAALATPRALRSQPCGAKAALYLLISILITTAGTGFIKGNISLSQNANYWKNITHFKDFLHFMTLD